MKSLLIRLLTVFVCNVVLFTSPSFSMDSSELAAFASSYQITGKEPEIYSFEDESCGFSQAVLVKTIKLKNNRIGGITFQGLCWGAVYTYFEMEQNNLESIREFSQVSAGRSTGFSNWGPSSASEDKITYEQLTAVAKLMTSNISASAEDKKIVEAPTVKVGDS